MSRVRNGTKGAYAACACGAQLLPRPMVKVQKRWRLGDTPVSLRLRYECPLEEVGRFYEPPARLLLRCARPSAIRTQ